MSLKERAIASNTERQKADRDRLVLEREATLDNLIENWEDRWKHRLDEAPPVPERVEFTFVRGVVYYGRGGNLDGWRFTIDDVDFLYSTTYGNTGLHVIVKCPLCGQEHCDSWYGLESLGRLLARQTAVLHKCHETAARSLAYQIGVAARDANLSFREVVELAFDHHGGMIHKGYGR